MNNISILEISENFTIEDIHKIREWNYERRKNMSHKELIADTKKGADEFLVYMNTKKNLSPKK